MNGRHANVELLLRKAKEKNQRSKPTKNTADGDDDEAMDEDGDEEGGDEEGNEQMIDDKYGPASINRMNKSRLCPLHLAVMNGHLVRFHIL